LATATANVTNRTSLRLNQTTIDRIRALARNESLSSDRDVAWSVTGRRLLEKALLEEEQRARPELVPLA
jgi:hypothetical protein